MNNHSFCSVNDIWFVVPKRCNDVGDGLFIYLNDPYLLNGPYIKDTSLVAITTNHAFC